MAGKNTKGSNDRQSWKKGDVVFTDRNGKPIDIEKFAQAALKSAAKPTAKPKKK